ncbi:methyltransferase domain-containing protein [bacterium]|nr:methyltransferase domain-containing protein [bacterium]
MPDTDFVSDHYTHGGLVNAIRDGIERLGKSTNSVDIHDLGPVDEFHIGGRIATGNFLDQLDIGPGHHVLDVGCGLGGSSRYAAHKYDCKVTGVDLTPEYVETGNILCSWVGLSEKVLLTVANATALPHADESFDRAYMLHVGMNIADKKSLASELHRIIRPGGKIGIYDVMKIGDGDIAFPVPWASEPSGSSVASPSTYKFKLEEAGFNVIAERNRRDFALDFFAQLQAKSASAEGPPALGLHILMGNSAPMKVNNMIDNISRGLIAPVEIIAEKAI